MYTIYMHICVIYEYVFFGYFPISFRMLSQQAEPNVLSLTKICVVSSFFEGFFRVMQGMRGTRGMRGTPCVLRLHVYTLYSHKVAVVAVAVVVGILR